MIIDSSAILAILFEEADAAAYAHAIEATKIRRMSAATYVETSVNVDARGDGRKLDKFIQGAKIIIEPLTENQARIARTAYAEYGKGNHPARLNLGDCFAYALSKDLDEPLLFKGDDFAQTDVESALAA